MGHVFHSNPTSGWSATLTAGDASQRTAPRCTNPTSGWSAMPRAGDALLRNAGCTTHAEPPSHGPRCSNTTLIKKGAPAVSQKWAEMAHRTPAELDDVEILLLQNVQAEFLFQDGPRERGGLDTLDNCSNLLTGLKSLQLVPTPSGLPDPSPSRPCCTQPVRCTPPRSAEPETRTLRRSGSHLHPRLPLPPRPFEARLLRSL